MSWPPASIPLRTRGRRFARAVYRAAVNPAGPEPMMTTFRVSTSTVILARGCPSPRSTRGHSPNLPLQALSGQRTEGAGVAGHHPDDHPVVGEVRGGALEESGHVGRLALEHGGLDGERDQELFGRNVPERTVDGLPHPGGERRGVEVLEELGGRGSEASLDRGPGLVADPASQGHQVVLVVVAEWIPVTGGGAAL